MIRVSRVILDMDGVIADFHRHWCKTKGHEWPDKWPKHHDCMYNLFNVTIDQFWEGIDTEWWASVPVTREFDRLIEKLLGRFRLCVTSIGPFSAVEGKVQWLDRHLPSVQERMFGTARHFMARSDSLLIDDNMDNCIRFMEHGGRAFCFPRPWNSSHSIEDRWEEYLDSYLR